MSRRRTLVPTHRCADALTQLDLAREDRHGAVRIDPQPGIQSPVAVETAGQARGLREPDARGQREADDQRARADERAAREAAAAAHERISLAARCTARTMRLCEAQRQRWPFSAALTSPSLGRGLRSSSAFADITMPLPQ